ncbi:MAG TPA: sialidase family protein [Bryobacteraceae bacterium]|nr:sialidase family protein [Bryobacteraceae bacterium]
MRILLILALAAATALLGGVPPSAIKNVVVYKESGRYGGWPANHGIWQWGNEILVGFSGAYYKHMPANRHQYDKSKPEEPKLARSLDGGETWTIESPKSLLPPEQGGLAVKDLPAPMDFRNPNFAMTIRLSDVDKGHSRLWYSTDRGKSWSGPYRFPDLGQPGILARTDYIVNGKHDAFAFLTASKRNGKEGRVICTRTTDGGMSWKLVSFIGEEPEGFAIMPSTVRLSKTKLVTAIRMKAPPDKTWIDLYESSNNGANWHILPSPVTDTGGHGGNPASMIRLHDGRLCLTYGIRSAPFSLRGRLSADGGRTWTSEFMIRAGGAAWDIGYPRTVQRPDGKVLTVYYFPEAVSSGRTIEATIWDPGKK